MQSVCMENYLFINQIEHNETIVKSFSKLKYIGDTHNYHTRSPTKDILDIPCFSTNFYEAQSAKYHCIIDWSNSKKTFPNGNTIRRHKLSNKITDKNATSQLVLRLS